MSIASRSPEGLPHQCPVCGAIAMLEPAFPGGDSVCPSCGQLLWWFCDRLGVDLALDSLLVDDLADSLDVVELVMALEEEFDLVISEEEAQRLHTIGDVIRYLRRLRGDEA
jgi:acyl carrier protein